MRQFFQRENTFFWLIILLAAAFRFYNYHNWSFTHDELGAFVRLNYSSFSDLIREGVKNDTHPVFTQLFLWGWAAVFGLSEVSVRLPFVLVGIASVALVYFIAKRWFGFYPALFSSMTIATLGFPILYSQLARPYSFGLFFSLLTVLCWTELLFGNRKNLYLKATVYGVVTGLCMLTHYFTFFFSVMVAISGFFFLKKETWKPYLVSGFLAFLIFLPHISVSLHQFEKRGIGEWLAKPETDFLWKYVLYAFNESPVLIISVAILFVVSLLWYHSEATVSKFHILCVAWFILPFLVGYYYSVYVNPVLQYSVLLFSFPFFPMALFSFFRDGNKKLNYAMLSIFTMILLYSTFWEYRFYKREQFGVYKEINHAVTELLTRYGKEKTQVVLNTSTKEIFDFYFPSHDIPEYDFILGDDSSVVADMIQKIDSCKFLYFLYGWSNFRSPYEIQELIKEKYPCILYDEKHFNSQVTLFGKDDECRRDTVFFAGTGFENRNFGQLKYDTLYLDTIFAHSGKYSLRVMPENLFCVTMKTFVKNVFPDATGCVNVSAWIYADKDFEAQMVMNISESKDKREWQAKYLNVFAGPEKKWFRVFVTFQIFPTAFPDDEIKIFLWNQAKNQFYVDDFEIISFSDSKYNYYATSFRK